MRINSTSKFLTFSYRKLSHGKVVDQISKVTLYQMSFCLFYIIYSSQYFNANMFLFQDYKEATTHLIVQKALASEKFLAACAAGL